MDVEQAPNDSAIGSDTSQQTSSSNHSENHSDLNQENGFIFFPLFKIF